MSIEKLKEIFFSLATVDSPFGFEEPMIKYFKSALEAYVDEVHANPRGNVVGVQLGSDPDAPRVALAAHMDQVGFVVFNIDSRGFLRFRKLGGPTHGAIQGQRVCLATEN
ncbi:MAG: M42 family peptidase, partial [Candidatus Bathyarchaeota archaeon]